MKTSINLTEEKFQEIYSNPEFRNEVAHAYKCLDSSHKFKYFETCSYPVRYIVTPEQIEAAKQERERAKQELLSQYNANNTLVFIGMGSTYTSKIEDDVCNYRVRTEFKNPEGRKFFIEFGTGRIDFAIDRDLEEEYNNKASELRLKRKDLPYMSQERQELEKEISKYDQQPYYNYKNLQREGGKIMPQYTKTALLEIVNKYFDCHFKEIVIDNYTLSTQDIICQSPSN